MLDRKIARPAVLSRAVGAVKRWPLWLLVLLSLGGYTLIRHWFPLASYFNHAPQPDIRDLAPSVGAGLGYVALLGALFGLYWLAYRKVRHGGAPLRLVSILLIAALFSVPLLFTFPFNATDIYRYFIRGRITTVYRQSPLSVAPDAFPDDPFLPLAGEWSGDTSPYGPVWELTAAAVTLLSGDNLWLGLLLFKGLAVLTHLIIAGLMWRMLEDAHPTERAGRVLLWAWNPALLLTFANGGHNDGHMLLWLMLGWWLMRRGRLAMGQMLTALAPLIKLVGLLPIPFFFLAAWQQLPNNRARVRFALTSAVGSLAVAWVAFVPFGSPLELVRRLLGEATSGGGFSPIGLIILFIRRCGVSISAYPVIQVASALFALFAAWLLWRTWQGRSPARGAADILAAYLAQAFKFRIWYAVWPFPWLLLDREDGSPRLMAGLWLLLTSQLSVFIYGHLWFYLLGGDALFSHLIGVTFTFVLPLIIACVRSGDGR